MSSLPAVLEPDADTLSPGGVLRPDSRTKPGRFNPLGTACVLPGCFTGRESQSSSGWQWGPSLSDAAIDVTGCQRARPGSTGQMARTGTAVARDPQLPERIEESRVRSAELMLSRQRYFTCTHWMA